MTNNIHTTDTLDIENFTNSKDGIKYKIVTSSDQKKAELGDLVTVHYTGWLLKGINQIGQKFDSSIDRGEPFQFNLGYGQVIEGWELSLSEMKIDEERIVILPPELGYGNRAVSVIPKNSFLIFKIKLLSLE